MRKVQKYLHLILQLDSQGITFDYIYNSQGFLTNINKGSTSIYSALSYYSSGALKDYLLGTTMVTKTYDDYQNIKKIQSTYINDEYKWDPVNLNLEEKKEHLHGLEYIYTYDNYERLTDEVLATRPSAPNHIEFYSNGNIDWKTSAGVYNYPTNKRIFGVHMMVPAETTPVEAHAPYEQKVTYASFYRPTNISLNGKSVGIQYNTSFDRSCATFNPGGVSPVKINRYYFGSSEVDYTYTGSTNTFKHSIDYIYAGDELVAMDVKTGSLSSKIWWVQTDYLGSIRAVFDNQNTVYFQNFDAWGVPRNVVTGDRIHNQKPVGLPDWLYRGYTGHEHYYELGLINLGARLYDPHNSRMLSPDLVLHNQSMQGFNRYSYANNNPLKYVDPDGNLPILAAMAIGAGISMFTKGISNVMNGDNFFAGSFDSWLRTAMFGAQSGAVASAIGGAFGAINLDKFGHELLRAGAHGLSGGMFSELQGGSFLAGAASGGLSSLAGSGFYGATKLATTNPISYVFSGVSGGVGSLAAGGNFWEGAAMGLIVHGLNHAANNLFGVSVHVETDGVGHVYQSIDGEVYSYGRYNGSYSPSSGSLGPVGEGVLNRENSSYLQERMKKNPTHTFKVAKIKASLVKKYLDNLFDSGKFNGENSRVINTYSLIGNNCSTFTCNALNIGGFNIPIIQTPLGMIQFFLPGFGETYKYPKM